MEDQMRKELIKQNKFRLRTQTIQIFGGLTGFVSEENKSEKQLLELHKKLKVKAINRKKSQDLSTFNNTHKTKEILVEDNFENLFQIFKNKLGEGAQSIVKKCKEKSSGKIYAVKLFRKIDEEGRANIKIQYKILKSLSHVNIIQAYYLFENQKQNNCQLVMEFCNYFSLRKYLEEETVIQEEEASLIIRKLLLAISYMNQMGVCHRDIKPQNILYDPITSSLKLVDYQTSKIYSSNRGETEMWTNIGTVYYKAPEIFEGQYSQNVDVWAIGVLTYQILTGRLPFQACLLKDTISLIKNHQPQFGQNISGFAKDFIKRCLIKDSTKRPKAVDILSSPFLLSSHCYISSPSPKGSTNLNRSFDQNIWKHNEVLFYHKSGEDGDNPDSFIGQDIGIRKFVDCIDDS